MSTYDDNPNNNGNANGSKGQLTSTLGFFLPIPETLLEAAPTIGANAFLLFSYLLSRCYASKRKRNDLTSWPSYQLIREETGLGFRAISSAIKRLKGAGFLEVEKRPNKNSRYTLIAPEGRDSRNANTGIRETQGESRQSLNPEKDLNKVREFNNNKVAENREKSLLSELKALKLPTPWIKNQLKQKGPERLRAVLSYAQAEAGEIANPGGWIRSAIEQEWEIPKKAVARSGTRALTPEEHGEQLRDGWLKVGWLSTGGAP